MRRILRHVTLNLLIAYVVPGTLFYVMLRTTSVWGALVVALAWCYGGIGWRLVTGRPASRLLVVAAVGLTARTALAMASGNTFIYFVQPVINNGLIALACLLSLATARPVVARIAPDFYPMSDDITGRAPVRRLFWWLTVLWAGVFIGKATMTMWLLESQTLNDFVVFKSVTFLVLTVGAAAVTVVAAARVARREGLLAQVVQASPALR
jgi:hypothetical protein